MKKYTILMLMVLGTVALFAQDTIPGLPPVDPPVVVDEPSKFAAFIAKYWDVLLLAFTASGIIGWLWYRLDKVKNFLDVLLVAGDDASPQGKKITFEEWQGIIEVGKLIFKPRITDIKAEVKKIDANNG